MSELNDNHIVVLIPALCLKISGCSAEQPEIFKQSAGMRTTMWLSFNSDTMTDLELTDYADRYLTDNFSTVEGVGRVRLGGQRELSLRVWPNS